MVAGMRIMAVAGMRLSRPSKNSAVEQSFGEALVTKEALGSFADFLKA
jgi:hypothetical protein